MQETQPLERLVGKNKLASAWNEQGMQGGQPAGRHLGAIQEGWQAQPTYPCLPPGDNREAGKEPPPSQVGSPGLRERLPACHQELAAKLAGTGPRACNVLCVLWSPRDWCLQYS